MDPLGLPVDPQTVAGFTSEQLVLKLLGPQPRMMDDLIAESGSSTAHVSAALMLLELKGLARKASGTTYIRVFGRCENAPRDNVEKQRRVIAPRDRPEVVTRGAGFTVHREESIDGRREQRVA